MQRLLPAVFLLSGVSALMYQVVWVRQLTLVFSTTVFAVSAVLSAFMAGLALGAHWLGKRADRIKRPLRLYILLELGIGLYALLTPWLFNHVDLVYAPLLAFGADQLWLLNLLRFVLAFAVIVVATALMGATLPVLARCVITTQQQVGQRVGSLYGMNTLGAVIGVVLSGFILIPFVGLLETLYSAVLINVSIAAGLALLLPAPPVLVRGSLAQSSPARHDAAGRWLLIAFAASGFAALAYEVIWTRVLSLVLGSSVYAFSIMLLTFLFGLALGSLIMVRLLNRFRGREWHVFAVLQLGIGLAVLLATLQMGQLSLWLLWLVRHLPASFAGVQLAQLGLSFLVMLPATLMLGALFPLVCRLYSDDLSLLGAQIGRLYAANTVGAIVGAIAAGFVLIPLLGSEDALRLLAALNIVIGVLMLWFFTALSRQRKVLAGTVMLVLLLVVNGFMPVWNPLLVNSNFANQLRVMALEKPAAVARYLASEVIYTDEDSSGNVLVYRADDGSLNLHVNGRGEGGTWQGDMQVQVELATIPALMHPAPRQALVVGLGPGISLGSLEQMLGVEQIDVVEISTGVVKAGDYFADYNHAALSDKRVRLIVDDARHFLAHTEKQYDLIVIGPSYSWVSGAANLFTREFLEMTRRHLKPDGLMSLWFQIYAMTPDTIKVFINTVNKVFPYSSIWSSSDFGELIALGSLAPHHYDYPLLVKRLADPVVAAEVGKTMTATAPGLISHYLMGGAELQAYAGAVPVNTDNHPYLEFMAPRQLFAWDLQANLVDLFGVNRSIIPPVTGLAQLGGRTGDATLSYPFIGLQVRLPGWQTTAGYVNRYDFVTAAHGPHAGSAALPQRHTVPRLRLQGPDGLIEIRASVFAAVQQGAARAGQVEDALRYNLASITGAPASEIRAGHINDRPLYWVGDGQRFIMGWYCRNNGFQYLARFAAVAGSTPEFAQVQALLARGLVCSDTGASQ
jgi:spermidine synthase